MIYKATIHKIHRAKDTNTSILLFPKNLNRSAGRALVMTTRRLNNSERPPIVKINIVCLGEVLKLNSNVYELFDHQPVFKNSSPDDIRTTKDDTNINTQEVYRLVACLCIAFTKSLPLSFIIIILVA